MKNDEQILGLRISRQVQVDQMVKNARDLDRAMAQEGDAETLDPENADEDGEDIEMTAADDLDPSKSIVIHFGSQNLRIGYANDALPKTIPMVIARRSRATELESTVPRPKRQKVGDNETVLSCEKQFGDAFAQSFSKQSNDLKINMRANKRKVLPNSKDLVINFNKRQPPELIPEHNDPIRIEWTTPPSAERGIVGAFVTGHAALRIPWNSLPKYKLHWPIRCGWYNEADAPNRDMLKHDIEMILEDAFRELGIESLAWLEQMNVVYVVPDLYDKAFIADTLAVLMGDYEFKKVCLVQESIAASFGAGYVSTCVVDVGAQKTSICCVEDGMCIEDSRINLKMGGDDVTELFIKMMLADSFPYQDINLNRRHDFLLAEELKQNFCTMNQADISPQLYNFHLRAPDQPTHKYQFKTYDEVILAPMAFYDPSLFDNALKLFRRRRLLPRSCDPYDPDKPDDPMSAAQLSILNSIRPMAATDSTFGLSNGADLSTPIKEKQQPFSLVARIDSDILGNTPGTSAAGSPGPEGSSTPAPFVLGTTPVPPNGAQPTGSMNGGTPAPRANLDTNPSRRSAQQVAAEQESILPIAALDSAILTSITHAARGDEKKMKDLLSSIMVIGGGAKTPGFTTFLEEKLKMLRPGNAKDIVVGSAPRDMDGQVVVWKGASVLARGRANDSWVTQEEWEFHGMRALTAKVLWNF